MNKLCLIPISVKNKNIKQQEFIVFNEELRNKFFKEDFNIQSRNDTIDFYDNIIDIINTFFVYTKSKLINLKKVLYKQ